MTKIEEDKMSLQTDLVRIAAPLRFQVEEAIRKAIGDGGLSPGQRLVERDLCERFAVSRPLLREALRRLEAERLVEISPNRGAQVVKPTLDDAMEICQVRAELEGLAAAIAAQCAPDEQVEKLGATLEALEEAVAMTPADPSEVRRRKNVFYAQLIDACGNRVLGETLGGLHIRVQLFRGASLAEAGRAEAATAELRVVFEAIARRDGRAARELTVLHLRNAARTLAIALARGEGRSLTCDELARIDTTPGFETLGEEEKA